jgi:hypothetical protein
MREIQLCVIGLLLSAAVWGQTEIPFQGVRFTPEWNSGGGIDLYVSNQTKLPVDTDRLAVELRLKTGQPCRFDYAKRLALKPAETVKIAVADAQGARKCLESKSAAARAQRPRALRFVRPSLAPGAQQLAAPATDALVVSSTWQVHGRALRNQSHWLVQPEDQ